MITRALVRFVLFAGIWLIVSPVFAQSEAPSIEPETAQPEIAQPETVEPEIDPEDNQFDIELDGRKTWTLRYGLGHPLGLATSGLSPGQLSLDQTLTVDVVGEALSVLTIEAHYNDQLPQTMQSLVLFLDTDRLDGVLGDFTFGSVPDFSAYSKKMKGLQLEYLIGDAVLTAVVSKTEGTSETAVFVGQTAQASVEYSERAESGSSERAPYRRNLTGLYAYTLDGLYTEEFSSVHFQFTDSPSLRNILRVYEVGFLFDAVISEPQFEMKAQDFRVLDADDQVLLLQRDPVLLVRQRLRDLFDVYNEQFELVGSAAKDYPFTAGTDYELQFLADVAPFAQIVVDDIVYPMGDAETRRFYDLGHSDVRANSTLTEISADGTIFEAVTSSRFPDFEVRVHEAAGILECDFPESFYTSSSILRIGFDYAVSEGAFMLGLSMIPGSERVTLNSETLDRDIDYMIDYEVGMLFMLIDLADTDVLQVDYERYAGGLFGAASDYASYFYGLTLDLPLSDRFSVRGNLLQLADAPGSATDSDRVHTMPNRHTIAGVQADISLDDLTASVLVGYNQDRFPFDDNERTPGTNTVGAIAAGEGYVLFGHRNGFTVNDGGSWETYGVGSGLSSQVVQAIGVGDGAVYLGTDAGLTVIQLDGTSPFDRAANWSRYFVDDGLPDSSVTAVLVHDEVVWIGTREGLAFMHVDGIDPLASWTTLESSKSEGLPPVTALAANEEILYIGTENGVYSHVVGGEGLDLIPGTGGYRVNDLVLVDESLYVASNRGLRGFRNGSGMGWLVLGESVFSVAHMNDTLYYGTAAGLVAQGGIPPSMLPGWEVRALEADDSGLWVGVRADETYEMSIWLLSDREQSFPESTTGISGQDPSAFIDTVAAEHTVTGWVTRASFRQNADDYTLSGVIESHPPTFRSIGSSRRSDSTGWSLSGDFSLGREGSLQVDHDYRMIGQSSETPSDRMGNGLFLDWSFADGPTVMASIRRVEMNETDSRGAESNREITTSFSMHESFFREALALKISWNRNDTESDRWDEQLQRESLSLSFDWRLSPFLSTFGSWSRPVRREEDDLSGTERLNWDWDLDIPLGFADLDFTYSADRTRTLFEEIGEWSHEAEIRLDLEPITVYGWNFTPDLQLEGEHEVAVTDLHAELTVRSDIEELSLRTTLRGHLTELGRPVFNREGELSIHAKYSGLASMDLSLTYTGSRSEAVKANDSAASSSDSIVGRLVWSPDDGPRDDLSFSLRIKEAEATRQVTAGIENGFAMNVSSILTKLLKWDAESQVEGYPIADLRVDSKADYRSGTNDPEFSFSTTGRILFAMAPRWNVSFATSYEMGHKTAIGLYHSFLFDLTFAI
ncbi:hypothetical protein ACFLSG_01810, partial [Candidatus Bipolaricaulota bacterium]